MTDLMSTPENKASRASWRSSVAVRAMLVAALAAGSFLGTYDFFSGPAGNTSESAQSSSNAQGSQTTGPDSQEPIAPFTTADRGSCLTWDTDAEGNVSNFEQASCEGEHRFEVSARENLAIYPTSEFGPEAKMPDLDRQAALREELCHSATMSYLDGRFDPSGKYDIAPILPPAQAWERGDRTMLCGLQTTDENGTPQITTGKVANSDQANLAQPGTCRRVDDQMVLHNVDCGDPHQLETVSIVDLQPEFPQGPPPEEDQDTFLSQRCAAAAIEYLGNEEALYQSTLQPYWGTVSEASWNGGTRSVNCSLMHANPDAGQFSTITGTAKDGREGLTINGAPPTEQPQRNPLRNPGATAADPVDPAQPTVIPGNVPAPGAAPQPGF